jgi:hypothetical protein
VLEEPRPELPEEGGIDPIGMGGRAFEEGVEASMIGVEEAVQGSLHGAVIVHSGRRGNPSSRARTRTWAAEGDLGKAVIVRWLKAGKEPDGMAYSPVVAGGGKQALRQEMRPGCKRRRGDATSR